MSLLAALVGAALGALLVAMAGTVGLHRDRGFHAALLILIAFLYPVFSWERFDLDGMALQALLAAPFVGVALIGYRVAGGAVLGLGFLLHGLFDVAAGALQFHAPMLWSEICLGFDVVLGVAARRFLR